MKKYMYSFAIISLVFCSKKEITEQNSTLPIVSDSLTEDSTKLQKLETEIIESKPQVVLNTFSELPAKYSNESDAVAILYTNENQFDKDGQKYAVCDFINNVVIIKINDEFEKLKDISGSQSYLENKMYENANYRLEFNLNEPVPQKTQDKILNNIPIEGAYVLKGVIKLIDLKTKEEIEKNTFVFGM